MAETPPEDLELKELAQKVHQMAAWLDEAFSASCVEEEYTPGCASCDAGMAIKHLRLIEKELGPIRSTNPGLVPVLESRMSENGSIPFHKGLPLVRAMPGWRCPYCGKPVGYMGNWLAVLFGARFHGCTFSNVRTTGDLRAWMASKRE